MLYGNVLSNSLRSRFIKNAALPKFIGGIVGVEVGNAPYKNGDRTFILCLRLER